MPYLELVVLFTVAVYGSHTWVDLRQLRQLRRRHPPALLATEFQGEKFAKIRRYSLDKWRFGFLRRTYQLGEHLLILGSGALPWLWRAAARAAPAVAARGEVAHTVVFALAGTAVSMVLELPWSWVSTFVVEQRHGFNNTTMSVFVSDFLKSLALGAVLAPPLVAGITWILMEAGPWVPLQLWGFLLAVSAVMLYAYPNIIAPLFNKFEPLPQCSLREAVKQLAKKLEFPLVQVYTMDGSKRSSHSNAYMYGFGRSKRIVLFDTLMSTCTEEEVVAVLAHELGHHKLRHVPVTFCIGQLLLLAQFLLLTVVRGAPGLYEAFGFAPGERPALVALVLFGYLSTPLDEVVQFGANAVSRRFEFQADRFAVRLGKGQHLRGALLHLEEKNKSALNVDPLYSAMFYSHPPLVERLAAIDSELRGHYPDSQAKKDS